MQLHGSSAKLINRRRLLHRRTPRTNTRQEMSRFWLRELARISPDQRKCNTQQIPVYTATQVKRSPESLPSDPKLIFMNIAQEFSLQQSLRGPKANKRPGKGSSGEKMRIRMEQPRRVTLQVGLGRTRIKGRIRRGRDEAPPSFPVI
jgi:hypothetical protein